MLKRMDWRRPGWAVHIEGITVGAKTSGDRGGGRAVKWGSRTPNNELEAE